jgi:hypothetical protein
MSGTPNVVNAAHIITSVALFHNPSEREAIPLAWFDRAIDWIGKYGLEPILFTAGGGPFALDDCFILSDEGEAIYRWGDPQPIVPSRRELIDALRDGQIYDLLVDVPRPDGKDRDDSRAQASLSSVDGEFYLGIDQTLCADPVALLQQALEISSGLISVGYGFAYQMPQDQDPAGHAMGLTSFSFADFKEWMRKKQLGLEKRPSADDLWQRELSENRRHLAGDFRGAYPVNVLSFAHVRAAGLDSSSIGQLSKLTDSLWLWKLTDAELPEAEAMLRAKRLLVAQLDDA